jgi:hypothetical protein
VVPAMRLANFRQSCLNTPGDLFAVHWHFLRCVSPDTYLLATYAQYRDGDVIADVDALVDFLEPK